MPRLGSRSVARARDWCCGARGLGRASNGDYVIVDMVRQQTGEPRKLIERLQTLMA